MGKNQQPGKSRTRPTKTGTPPVEPKPISNETKYLRALRRADRGTALPSDPATIEELMQKLGYSVPEYELHLGAVGVERELNIQIEAGEEYIMKAAQHAQDGSAAVMTSMLALADTLRKLTPLDARKRELLSEYPFLKD